MTFMVDIRNGELLQQLQAAVTERDIQNAAILLIGAVDEFTISTMPAHDATQDEVMQHELPAELLGIGEVVNGQVHVHVTCGIEGNRALAGHLHSATVQTFFIHAYVTEIEQT